MLLLGLKVGMSNNKTIPLYALEIQPDETVSLHVVTGNCENIVTHLLDDVAEFIDEFHFVLTDTTDHSDREIERLLARYPWARRVVELVTPTSHPELYILDESSTYLAGTSLDGEVLGGSFSRKFLLANRGGARSLCSRSDASRWQLHLETDDWVTTPYQIPMIVKLAAMKNVDVVSTGCSYENIDLVSARCTYKPNSHLTTPYWRPILTRNIPSIVWEGKLRPTPEGFTSQLSVENILPVISCKEETASELENNFKVLYHSARMLDWNVSPEHLESMILVLVCMGASSPLPREWIAGPLFSRYSKVAHLSEHDAQIRLLAGLSCDVRGNLACSPSSENSSPTKASSSEIFFRMALLNFRLGQWRDCIVNYELGRKESAVEPDSDLKLESATQLLAAESFNRLRNKPKAMEYIDDVSKSNMRSIPVANVWKHIYEGV